MDPGDQDPPSPQPPRPPSPPLQLYQELLGLLAHATNIPPAQPEQQQQPQQQQQEQDQQQQEPAGDPSHQAAAPPPLLPPPPPPPLPGSPQLQAHWEALEAIAHDVRQMWQSAHAPDDSEQLPLPILQLQASTYLDQRRLPLLKLLTEVDEEQLEACLDQLAAALHDQQLLLQQLEQLEPPGPPSRTPTLDVGELPAQQAAAAPPSDGEEGESLHWQGEELIRGQPAEGPEGSPPPQGRDPTPDLANLGYWFPADPQQDEGGEAAPAAGAAAAVTAGTGPAAAAAAGVAVAAAETGPGAPGGPLGNPYVPPFPPQVNMPMGRKRQWFRSGRPKRLPQNEEEEEPAPQQAPQQQQQQQQQQQAAGPQYEEGESSSGSSGEQVELGPGSKRRRRASGDKKDDNDDMHDNAGW